MGKRGSKIQMLLIADRPGNVRRFASALDERGSRFRLQVVGSDSEALAYLRRDHPYREAPRPDLIVFDLSESGRRQLTTLDDIRNDHKLGQIPMALLVGADSERRLRNIYSHRRNCTIMSPLQLDNFLLAMTDYESGRFLSAAKLLNSLGLILVSVPDAYLGPDQRQVAEAG